MRCRALLAASAAQGNDLITFTINDTEYQAEEGMIWVEWVNSEYNVDREFFLDIDNSIGNGYGYWIGTEEGYVYASDIIQENYNYFLAR